MPVLLPKLYCNDTEGSRQGQRKLVKQKPVKSIKHKAATAELLSDSGLAVFPQALSINHAFKRVTKPLLDSDRPEDLSKPKDTKVPRKRHDLPHKLVRPFKGLAHMYSKPKKDKTADISEKDVIVVESNDDNSKDHQRRVSRHTDTPSGHRLSSATNSVPEAEYTVYNNLPLSRNEEVSKHHDRDQSGNGLSDSPEQELLHMQRASNSKTVFADFATSGTGVFPNTGSTIFEDRCGIRKQLSNEDVSKDMPPSAGSNPTSRAQPSHSDDRLRQSSDEEEPLRKPSSATSIGTHQRAYHSRECEGHEPLPEHSFCDTTASTGSQFEAPVSKTSAANVNPFTSIPRTDLAAVIALNQVVRESEAYHKLDQPVGERRLPFSVSATSSVADEHLSFGGIDDDAQVLELEDLLAQISTSDSEDPSTKTLLRKSTQPAEYHSGSEQLSVRPLDLRNDCLFRENDRNKQRIGELERENAVLVQKVGQSELYKHLLTPAEEIDTSAQTLINQMYMSKMREADQRFYRQLSELRLKEGELARIKSISEAWCDTKSVELEEAKAKLKQITESRDHYWSQANILEGDIEDLQRDLEREKRRTGSLQTQLDLLEDSATMRAARLSSSPRATRLYGVFLCAEVERAEAQAEERRRMMREITHLKSLVGSQERVTEALLDSS